MRTKEGKAAAAAGEANGLQPQTPSSPHSTASGSCVERMIDSRISTPISSSSALLSISLPTASTLSSSTSIPSPYQSAASSPMSHDALPSSHSVGGPSSYLSGTALHFDVVALMLQARLAEVSQQLTATASKAQALGDLAQLPSKLDHSVSGE